METRRASGPTAPTPADVSGIVQFLGRRLGQPVTVLRCLRSDPQPDGDTVQGSKLCTTPTSRAEANSEALRRAFDVAQLFAAVDYATKLEALPAHDQWWLWRFVPWLIEAAQREAASLLW